MASATSRVLRTAQGTSKKAKDSHVGVDALFHAIVTSNDSPTRAVFEAAGIKGDDVQRVIDAVRGGRPVTSATSDQVCVRAGRGGGKGGGKDALVCC